MKSPRRFVRALRLSSRLKLSPGADGGSGGGGGGGAGEGGGGEGGGGGKGRGGEGEGGGGERWPTAGVASPSSKPTARRGKIIM